MMTTEAKIEKKNKASKIKQTATQHKSLQIQIANIDDKHAELWSV
jgi:hypothetical protein